MAEDEPTAWVGLVDVGPTDDHRDTWTAQGGRGGAIVWAAARAVDEATVRDAVDAAAAEQGWHVRAVDDAGPWGADEATAALGDLVAEVEVAEGPTVAWGPLQTYPEDDLSDAAFLVEVARGDDLTAVQSEVVATVADMLDRLDLPRLDGTSFHLQDDHAVVVLSPVDERDHDLVVAVGDEHVDIDHGWAHETFDVDDDGLDEAYQFLFSALQGGVKVEVFRSWGRVRKVHTHVLVEGETWQHAFTMGMFVPPGFRDPPPTTHVLGFA